MATELSTTHWRTLDRATLDRAYNNAAAVPGSAGITADWARRSATLRSRAATRSDWRYAPGERCAIDLFSAGPDAPLVVFFHGGYWQMRAKEDFSFVAEGPLQLGLSVALVGYTLAPEAGMARIVEECGLAVATLRGELRLPMLLAGWSAGAHLAAEVLANADARGALAISGIYDLEPIRHSYLNDKLALDAPTSLRHSPMRHLPAGSPPLHLAWGDAELPELRRQSQDYAAARRAAGLPTLATAVPGAHHFSVLEQLARADGVLARALADLARPR